MVIAPAVGGGLFTKKKAKKLFYTKSQSDSRFLTPAAADSRYLPNSGIVKVQVPPTNWQAVGQPPLGVVNRLFNSSNLSSSSVQSGVNYAAGLTIPAVLQGRPTRIDSFELCTSPNTSAVLAGVLLSRATDTTGSGNTTSFVNDTTLRTTPACRTYPDPQFPVAVGPDDIFQVVVQVNYTAAPSSVTVDRLTINMSD